jgi:SNF2 family DNA or RNA helicase
VKKAVYFCLKAWYYMAMLSLILNSVIMIMATPILFIDIDEAGRNLLVSARHTPENLKIMRSVPELSCYSNKLDVWMVRPTGRNVKYLMAALTDAWWSPQASDAVAHLTSSVRAPAAHDVNLNMGETPDIMRGISSVDSIDYDFGESTPRGYQVEALARMHGAEAFALLMEPRTGKTFVAIHDMARLYEAGRIDRALVICLKSIKSVWVAQLAEHMPSRVPVEVFEHSSSNGPAGRADLYNWVRYKPQALQILVVNVDVLASAQVGPLVRDFATGSLPTAVYIDESSSIKSSRADRTRAALAIGAKCAYRRILNGSPAPNSPEDLYSQYKFLDPKILGCRTLSEFRDLWMIAKPTGRKFLTFLPNVPKLGSLYDRIRPYSFRVRRDQVFKFIPREHREQVKVQLTGEQRRLYRQMRDDLLVEFEGHLITAAQALTAMLRLQQIVGGFVGGIPSLDLKDDARSLSVSKIPGPNPKVQALHDIITQYPDDEKFVIWALFQHEVEMLADELSKVGGTVKLYGRTSERERIDARTRFQDPNSGVRFLVGNPQAGGLGISLSASSTCIYYSNGYSLLNREQSEARILHDADHEMQVAYYDLMGVGTVDESIVKSLAKKQSIQALLSGDIVSSLRSII